MKQRARGSHPLRHAPIPARGGGFEPRTSVTIDRGHRLHFRLGGCPGKKCQHGTETTICEFGRDEPFYGDRASPGVDTFRKTGHKWPARHAAGGMRGAQEPSRARKNVTCRTSEEVERLIVAEKRLHPTWGPEKLHRMLSIKHGIETPPWSARWVRF